jgi:anaerobic ribonucleoside-triphosphate reductase
VTPEICPHCGAEVPANSRSCPECGSDDETGWSERATTRRLDLPDPEFDYDDFVKREFGEESEARLKPRGVSWGWWIVAVILILILLGLFYL